MRRFLDAAGLTLLCALCAGWAPSPAWSQPPMQVIGFDDSLVLQVNGSLVRLIPGEEAYSVEPGVKTRVVEGSALFLLDGVLVSAKRGDAFTYQENAVGASLAVHAGSPEITLPGKPPVPLAEGRSIVLTGARAGELSGAALPPGFVPTGQTPAAAGPVPAPGATGPLAVAGPAQPEQPWDPLTALAQAMDKLSRMQRPTKVQLVLDLHPYYSFSETYDSNIYMVPKDQANGTVTGGGVVGSWMHVQRAGTTLTLPLNRRHKLEASYDLTYTVYSQAPRTNNAFNQSLGGDYEYTGIRGVRGRVWDRYVNTEDPAFSELVARQRRYTNESGLRLDVERSRRFTYSVAGQETMNKYLDPAMGRLLNRFDISFGGDVGLRIQPRTRLYLAYRRELSHYSAGRGDHSKSHRMGVGLDGRLLPRLSGKAQVDIYMRRYATGGLSGNTSVRDLTSSVDLAYAASERAKLNLRVNRSLSESTFAGNRYYVGTSVSLSGSYAYRSMGFGADVGFESDRYPETTTVMLTPVVPGTTANRRDKIYRLGLNADYRVRPWLTTGLNYSYSRRRSNFADQFDYKDHRTCFQLRMGF